MDGVLSTNPNSFSEELFDVEQIEVLKGPQGALYGVMGYRVPFATTKKPSEEAETEIAVGVGNNNSFKVHAVASGPVSDDMAGRTFSTRETWFLPQ